MKIAVFGATGGAGIQVVEQALAKGYQVVAFTRSLDKLKVKDENTIPFEGDIQNSDEVAAALEEVKAVISVLGPTDNRSQFGVSSG
jgi:putative NADH-flavin reductase